MPPVPGFSHVLAVWGLALAVRTTEAQPSQTAEESRPLDGLALVRCVDGRPLPCVRARVTVDRAAARGPAGDGADVARWAGTLGPYTLQPVGERIVRGGPPNVVLVLIDASGSMAGEGVQVARAAVRSFLRDLATSADSAAGGAAQSAAPGSAGVVRVGVAPFASRGVGAAIRASAFGTLDAAARAIDGLAPPAGNTGLYSAVAAGAERVAAEARTIGGARAALVVVTDGRNDVHDASGRTRPGDDPGLLDGAAGRTTAAELARRLNVPLYFIGVGGEPDMAELQALAGSRGLARRTALDAVALQEALAEVARALTPTREITFAVLGAERTSLTGAGWPVELVRSAGEEQGTHFAGRWRAPLLTAPAFDGAIMPAATAPQWLRADPSTGLGQRGMVALFLVALCAGAWWLPRVLWLPDERVAMPTGAMPTGAMPTGAMPAGATPGSSRGVGLGGRTIPLTGGPAAGAVTAGAVTAGAVSGRPRAATEPGRVRAGVQEGAPRRPTDVTAEFAVPVSAPRDAAHTVRRRGSTFAIQPSASSMPPRDPSAASELPSPRPDPD